MGWFSRWRLPCSMLGLQRCGGGCRHQAQLLAAPGAAGGRPGAERALAPLQQLPLLLGCPALDVPHRCFT